MVYCCPAAAEHHHSIIPNLSHFIHPLCTLRVPTSGSRRTHELGPGFEGRSNHPGLRCPQRPASSQPPPRIRWFLYGLGSRIKSPSLSGNTGDPTRERDMSTQPVLPHEVHSYTNHYPVRNKISTPSHPTPLGKTRPRSRELRYGKTPISIGWSEPPNNPIPRTTANGLVQTPRTDLQVSHVMCFLSMMCLL